jgi:hypothetical protein
LKLNLARNNIDANTDDHHIEEKRDNAVQQNQTAHVSASDLYVRGLKSHVENR